MKVATTAEQRKAWQEVHKAISDYIINFGRIEVGTDDNHHFIDFESRYTECGKLYCPDFLLSEK